MELNQRLERIEQLKTDEHMRMLLEGLKVIGGLDKFSYELFKEHKVKNPTINSKLSNFRGALVDEYNTIAEKFTGPASREILKSCGIHVEDDMAHDCINDYTFGYMTFDEMIEALKQHVIEVDSIPEGHVMIKFGDDVQYIPEDKFNEMFPDDDDE